MRHYFIFLALLLLTSCNNAADKAALENLTKAEAENRYRPSTGDIIDRYNKVPIYYNGSPTNTFGRNTSDSGYNFGLKWQCVEFVKRYYYSYLNHKMPNTWGHAKDFIDLKLKDGALNKKRNLYQYNNRSISQPQKNDILVFNGHAFNKYGHIAIVSDVGKNFVEVVQQNVGIHSREKFKLVFANNKWTVKDTGILGWLRKGK